MNFNINVINQRMFFEKDSVLNGITNDSKEFVEGSQEFVRFHFSFSEEWDSLTVFAQFIQSGKSYNVYLDDNNNVYLPSEIKSGKCNLVLYGSKDKIIATTNYISLILNKYLLIQDASSTEITESLYNQLVNKVEDNKGVVKIFDSQPNELKNGFIWYDSIEHKYKCIENGRVKTILTE